MPKKGDGQVTQKLLDNILENSGASQPSSFFPLFSSSNLNMRSPVCWSWTAALLFFVFLGQVWCECPTENMGIEGGHYKLTREQQPGSMLIYYCPEGYYPYPALTRTCHQNGAWKPAPKRFVPQRCRVVECPDPNVLEYGTVSPPQERYFVDNETAYECDSGYTQRGSARRVCLPNGKWSGSTPICSRDTGDHCADPGIPAGAMRTGNIFGIGDKVTYNCNSNLFLMGTSERTCQENRQWTGFEPACYYKHTYDTPLEVSQAFGSAIKESLTTLESINDVQGERRIRISKNGTLNIYIAVDISESIEKEHVANAKDAISKLITKISSFSVSPNYELLFFSSELSEVVSILDFFDGQEVNMKEKLEKFTVKAEHTGTDLNLAFKTILERMALIKQRVGEKTFEQHRHAIIVFTDGVYNMGGSPLPTVAKIKNLVYMNHTSEEPGVQPREEYLDIYIFGIGAEIYESDLKPLTAGTGGNHFFKMKDITNLQETFDEIIDEEEVVGMCGLHKEYETAEKDSTRKMYPWMASIVVQVNTTKNCLGSLVSPQFVLTAAHCFTFGDLPKNIVVEIDDGNGRSKRVKTFKLHPKYNINAKAKEGVKEFYDYDVALIQLEEDVQISSAVRPICVPCTQETSGALGLVGDSTCKQQEEELLKTHLEKLNFLTKKNAVVQEKEVHAKLGDNRDECIRYALEAEGITTTNPEIPVTDNFLCTGGQLPFRDHIACTGDSGGAVFKNYKHRTIQVALVSWGTQYLCKSGTLLESTKKSRDFHLNLFRVVPFLKGILGNDTQDEYAPLHFLST
ncbi:complement factor B-like isoform X2 [Takifugu flavidus]|uniref:complement factor B-like isoform X2 n=1 Tax=Takifugu flavidus TaxID=433684 RepID=UPI002544C900|nr:complement factor B-like isoform X2 [Takifugu flavidus]